MTIFSKAAGAGLIDPAARRLRLAGWRSFTTTYGECRWVHAVHAQNSLTTRQAMWVQRNLPVPA